MPDPAQPVETNRGPTLVNKPPAPARPTPASVRRAPSIKPPRSSARPRRKDAAKKGKPQTALVARLKGLRQVTRETAQAYLLKIDAALAAIIRGLEENDLFSKDHALKPSAIKQMLKLLKRIDPKPVKGRRKDLRKIEKAVEAMMQIMPKKQLGRTDPKTSSKNSQDELNFAWH